MDTETQWESHYINFDALVIPISWTVVGNNIAYSVQKVVVIVPGYHMDW